MNAIAGTDKNHVKSLDGLRGLAALSVVVLHFASIFWDTQFPEYSKLDEMHHALDYSPVAVLWSGSQGVFLFFILSGFALDRMLASARTRYAAYIVRRIFRLWVPYAVAITVALLLLWVQPNHPIEGQSEWLNSFLGRKISGQDIAWHYSLAGPFDSKGIDFVVWSLVHEMRISLLFPLLFALLRWPRQWPVVAVSAMVSATSLALQKYGVVSAEKTSLALTAEYQVFFVIGALISMHETAIRKFYASVPGHVQALLALAALAIYGNCLHSLFVSGLLGGALIVVFALCSAGFSRILNHPISQELGRSSYSLYLYHIIVLFFFINSMYPGYSFGVIECLALPTVFVAALMGSRLVEEPANRRGRALAQRMPGPP